MKKIKLLLFALAVLLIIPFGVFADDVSDVNKDENQVVESNEVKVYLFYGDGCGFCAQAKEWFTSIEEKYGHKFELVKYEVWKNESNSKLMQAVSEVRKETVGGVPYIIIGNQSWDGFSVDMTDSMLEKIESEYKQEPSKRYDVLNYIDLEALFTEKDTTARDVLVLLVFVGVIALVSVGVVVARKKTN